MLVDDARLAKLVRRCQELPGQALFQYVDEEGSRHAIDSGQVNDYLRERMGEDFTAKDFRTWHATLHALTLLESDAVAGAAQRGRAAPLHQRRRQGRRGRIAQHTGGVPQVVHQPRRVRSRGRTASCAGARRARTQPAAKTLLALLGRDSRRKRRVRSL